MSGQESGFNAAVLRAALAAAEVPYSALMRLRNRLYDRGALAATRLARPVVSVGNITTGGTGKTPVVRWLAESLAARGLRPAILMRGYTRGTTTTSDEQSMLREQLPPEIPVAADPDRIRAAAKALVEQPKLDVYLLDDGMQHRRLARDFELTLVNAADPFGYAHVLPRGLLREPLPGLARAHAFLLTRATQADPASLRQIESTLAAHNPSAPVYRCDHVHTGLRTPREHLPTDSLRDRRIFTFCGIGSPESFDRQVRTLGATVVGTHPFPDHHDYSERDLAHLQTQARSAGAELLLTTEKDWAKLKSIPPTPNALETWRIELGVQFSADDADRLLTQIINKIHPSLPRRSS
jgi:tetraacyldisaccharide 4'-kinase